ncbi:MAG: hypothetical protein COA49_01555 [Bacteroidetes bacterium]|nr:MAG: hypothetical protein COA49_01555 [Bacteroidota bacterium]
MRKNIDIDESLILKLKLLAVYENMSVKAIMEEAVSSYVKQKEIDRIKELSEEEKEDLGLLLLMQQTDTLEVVTEKEVLEYLDKPCK